VEEPTITLEKSGTFHSAHFLPNHQGKCKNFHGHSWHYNVTCRGKESDLLHFDKPDDGMIIDFGVIKAVVDSLCHKDLNKIITNPTAERIALFIMRQIPSCVKVELWETDTSKVTVEV